MTGFSDDARNHLLAAANDDGGWGYRADTTSATEPTAVALLALHAVDAGAGPRRRAVDWLLARQTPDGGFPAAVGLDLVGWATGIALIALRRAAPATSDAVRRAANWLVQTSVYGPVTDPKTSGYGYDTSLIGWAWTEGDFSFTEPTAFALIGLKQTALRNHARVAQGEALLRDRFTADGGWNYGEPKVLGRTLPVQVVPTALALLALQDTPDEWTKAGLEQLVEQTPKLTSPLSLGYGANALTAFGRADVLPAEKVAAFWRALPESRRGPLETALLLLATAPPQRNGFLFS